jgi:hypothetical protein
MSGIGCFCQVTACAAVTNQHGETSTACPLDRQVRQRWEKIVRNAVRASGTSSRITIARAGKGVIAEISATAGRTNRPKRNKPELCAGSRSFDRDSLQTMRAETPSNRNVRFPPKADISLRDCRARQRPSLSIVRARSARPTVDSPQAERSGSAIPIPGWLRRRRWPPASESSRISATRAI